MNALLNELIRIPHLRLKKQFDVNKMLEEIALVEDTEYQNYSSKYGTGISQEIYAKNWSGISLFGHKLTEGDDFSREPTEYYHKMPYFASIIDSFNNNHPARIMRIAPKGHLLYHSHVQEHGQPKDLLTIQIPIVMPDKFYYIVTSKDNVDLDKRVSYNREKVIWQQYKPGEMWVFNSYHFHNVINYTDEYRITLMLYLPMRNIVELLTDAINDYDGPYLE